jgi:hypothetical protein
MPLFLGISAPYFLILKKNFLKISAGFSLHYSTISTFFHYFAKTIAVPLSRLRRVEKKNSI